MSLRSCVGSHRPVATGGRVVRSLDGSSFLSGLDNVFCLANLDHPEVIGQRAASAAVILSVDHFQLPQPLGEPCAFEAVCGGDWSQAMWSAVNLACQAVNWALERQLDPQAEPLIELWSEGLSLAWWSELTARTHLLPAPYWAWQAGLALAATAVSEQLRSLDQDGGSDRASLGPAAMRQLENLVLEHRWPACLSLVQAVRKGSYLGPWPAVALAHRLARRRDALGWASGVLGQVEQLPSVPVLEKCLRGQLGTVWPEYLQLAERIWQMAVALARRGEETLGVKTR